MTPLIRTLGGFLTLSCLFVALTIPAQEKTDETKKDEKKDTAKKVEDKFVFGQVFRTTIKKIDSNSNRNFFIEVPFRDPKKVLQVQQWAQAEQFKVGQGDPRQYASRVRNFQTQYAQKMATEIYSMKEVEYRATEDCKVRLSYLPTVFDDATGAIKNPSKKDIEAIKAKDPYPKLKGFHADFDALRPGQLVDLYLAKVAPMPKEAKTGKKKDEKKDDPAPEMAAQVPEVVMILVVRDALSK